MCEMYFLCSFFLLRVVVVVVVDIIRATFPEMGNGIVSGTFKCGILELKVSAEGRSFQVCDVRKSVGTFIYGVRHSGLAPPLAGTFSLTML